MTPEFVVQLLWQKVFFLEIFLGLPFEEAHLNEAETDASLVISAMAEMNKPQLALLVPHCSNMAKKVQVSVCINIDKIAIILFKQCFIKIMERETIST